MSAAASWSYTSRATHWPLAGRDDWAGARTFGPPVVFLCDYTATSGTEQGGAQGTRGNREGATKLTIHTERAIARGDMVLIGESAEADPVAAGAAEVLAVTRYPDTLGGLADDWKAET